MGFLNVGKKDEYGKQRRIEHRGKYLRASRTGGVALRAQAKALGANLTANTSHGFRVSTTPLKNTQVALQNGRFVLRGRYSHGPFHFNLSKTGVTASTRNQLGSFNWVKPNRSSAKIFGIQLRGRKAANLQMSYMIISAIAALLGLMIRFFIRLFEILMLLPNLVCRGAIALPYGSAMVIRRYRNRQLSTKAARLESSVGRDLDSWQIEELIAGAVLILAAWGRGNKATETAPDLKQTIAECDQDGALQRGSEALSRTALRLENYRETNIADPDGSLTVLAMLASRLAHRISGQELPEVILEADDIVLKHGVRTVLQDRMLEVFGDFAGLHLLEEDEGKVQSVKKAQDEEIDHTQNSRLDLNRASLEELRALPHIGEERANAIIARRPFTDIEELKEIDGIGPKRLESIRRHAKVQ